VLALEEPQYVDYLTEYFDAVYADKADEFFERCLFVCDPQGKPVGTCFLWKAYGKIETIHWLHVLPEYEGLGLGRALLTEVLQQAKAEDFPIYLHTHPHCLRAVHLYNEFGFQLVTDPVVGYRSNDWEEAMKYLKLYMPEKYVEKLQFVRADEEFLQAARSSEQSEF
jgi:GNAT superfamily N-acetyltransferase